MDALLVFAEHRCVPASISREHGLDRPQAPSAQFLGATLKDRATACRYYGKSKPFPPKELRQNMEYLSADQALVRMLRRVLQMFRCWTRIRLMGVPRRRQTMLSSSRS